MIIKEQAMMIASEKLRSIGLEEQYNFDSCEFLEEFNGKYPSPARWIVRFLKPPSLDGSVTDDGVELFVVTIEAESGIVRVSCGF